MFYYFGGDPKNSMEHIKRKEAIVPANDSEEVLIQVEVRILFEIRICIDHSYIIRNFCTGMYSVKNRLLHSKWPIMDKKW